MPTGYTYMIEENDDLTFKDFALKCSRAFGALVELRDTPNAPIPEKFEISEYYYKNIKEDEEKLEFYKKIPLEEAEELINEEFKEKVDSLKRSINNKIKLLDKYNKMLLEVENWTPPTKKHFGLKDFMVQQLKDSIEADCDYSYDSKILDELELKTPHEYKAQKIKFYKESLEYSNKRLEEAKNGLESRNNWLKNLRDSL